MGKWLAGAGVVLLVILLLLWRQLDSSSATPAPQEPRAPQVASATPAPANKAEPAAQAAVADTAPAPAASDTPKKMDPQSDDFFFKHDEMVVPRLSREAVKCIEGHTEKVDDRNKSVVIKFKQHVRSGKVEITDVEVERSTLTDPALEACFIQQVRNTTWTDAAMPDWDQEDQIKLGFRQLKKYTRANIDYVGEEAPAMMPKPADH